MTVLKLIRYDFDTMENSVVAALIIKEVAVAVDDKEQTAHAKIAKVFKAQINIEPYLAWNNEVYPKFEVKKVQAL